MVKCSAPQCSSATYHRIPRLSFHRFPKDNKLKEIWLQKMNRSNWLPSSSSVLCSNHFEPQFKDSSAFCTVLRPGAIPTLFENNSENEEILPTPVGPRNFVAIEQDLDLSSHSAASEDFVSIEQDLHSPTNSAITVQYNVTPKVKDHDPVSPKLERMKRKISLKNKKVKSLQQKTRRLKRKLSQFSEIISNLKRKYQGISI